ncbi:MAG: glycosyltransferase family 39 protein [Opitutaceae bacterium]|nr:glycosyltransferase family 39 protein [Opitutaceae bacterium]
MEASRWQFLSRSDVRLAAFGFCALLAVWLGFIGIGVARAELWIKHGGYYVMLGTFVLWLAALWRLRHEALAGWSRRERITGTVLVALFSVVAVVHEDFRSKILYDEFVLQSTAYNMHFFRDVATMVRGYDILGTFLSTDNYLDKRPYFYPFLVSLVHDLTGYRTQNAYLLNALLTPVCLGLVYGLGRCWQGWRTGALAVALVGSLPLFAQNATGSGMELLNLTMLLAAVALGASWLARPDGLRLSAFILAVVLLAQCRYESALYVVPAAMVVLAGWWRGGRIVLSGSALLAPLLLVPVALHNRVLSHTPVLWEMKDDQTSRFGWEYLADNFRAAADFLFSTDVRLANSLWLTVVGGLGLLVLAGWVLWRRPAWRRMSPLSLAWLFIGLGICTNTLLVMFYFWSAFNDPMAARFSLPFCLLLAFAVVFVAARFDARGPVAPALLGLTLVCWLGFSLPRQAQHHYSHLGIDEIEWERRLVAARPPAARLIISNKSGLPWLLQKTPSILIDRARLVPDRLQRQLADGYINEILVMQSLRPTSVHGQHELVPEEILPAGYRLELVAEKRFGTKLARVSRLVAVELPPPPAT